jgi:hypothetical protein
MLCRHDSIRHDDPSVQRLLRVVEAARSLTTFVLVAWQVGYLHVVHLIEASWSPESPAVCLALLSQVCCVALRSKGFARRHGMSRCHVSPWCPGPIRAGCRPVYGSIPVSLSSSLTWSVDTVHARENRSRQCAISVSGGLEPKSAHRDN